MTHTENKAEQHFGKKLAFAASSLTALYALPQAGEAAIVYNNTPITKTAASNSTTNWDVDGNGSAEFKLKGVSTSSGARVVMLNSNSGANARGLMQKTNVGNFASSFQNLPLNVVVGQTLAAAYRFGGSNQAGRWVTNSNRTANTAKGFSEDVLGYIGFKFVDAGAALYYGWAALTINGSATAYTINEWAYNNTPNAAINVGDTGQSVPEPSIASLALLGMGAGGVRAWRRRKQAALQAAA